MVTKTTKLLSLGAILILLYTGCVSRKAASSARVNSEPEFIVNWVKPTYSSAFKVHRKMNRMTPVVTDQLVIQGNNLEDLVAYDRKLGWEIWRSQFKGGIEAGAYFFKNRIYVTTNDGSVQALEATTGKQIWTFATSSENVSAPVLDAQTGLLYFQNAQNIVFCLDAATGKQIWIYSKNDSAGFSIRGAATPTLGQGQVYVGFSDGSFVSLKAANGQVSWDQTLNRNKKFRDVDAGAVIYKDLVIVSGYDDKVYALDALRGSVVWSYPVGSSVAVTLVKDQVLVGSLNNSILKLKADSGELIWAYNEVKGVPTQAVVFGNLLLFGESQGKLKALDIDSGKLVGKFEPGRGVFSKPYVDEEKSEVFFISGEAYLYNLRLVKNQKHSFSFIQ